MFSRRSALTVSLVLEGLAAVCLGTHAHASPRGIRVDGGWNNFTSVTSPYTFTPAAFATGVPQQLDSLNGTDFSAWPALTVTVNSPSGLFGTDISDTNTGDSDATNLGVDALIWCATEACQANPPDSPAGVYQQGVLAELVVGPSTNPDYFGDLEFDLDYYCSSPFTFSVAGGGPVSLPNTCQNPSGEESAEFIYAYTDGSLHETTLVPEPGSLALFAGVLGLIGMRRRSRRGG